MKCAKCGINEAPVHPQYGPLHCNECNKKSDIKASKYPEFIPERIKNDRKKYFNSMVQPWRGDIASQEYIDAHGTKNFTPEEVKRAKDVWRDIPGYATRNKSL